MSLRGPERVDPNSPDPDDTGLEVLITAEAIQSRVAELGRQITLDYRAKKPALITILRGAWMFAADLSRALNVDHTVDFLSVQSYVGRRPTGKVRIKKDVDDELQGRHVLVVEDIVDTGATLQAILDILGTKRPASLRVAALLNKAPRRRSSGRPDYVGFEIPNRFVVGYGLDLDGHYRGLPYIATVPEDVPPVDRVTSGP